MKRPAGGRGSGRPMLLPLQGRDGMTRQQAQQWLQDRARIDVYRRLAARHDLALDAGGIARTWAGLPTGGAPMIWGRYAAMLARADGLGQVARGRVSRAPTGAPRAAVAWSLVGATYGIGADDAARVWHELAQQWREAWTTVLGA